MSKIQILQDGGGGCKWLSHLLFQLQHNKELVHVDVCDSFDRKKSSNDLKCYHFHELTHDMVYYAFTTEHVFNALIANYVKNTDAFEFDDFFERFKYKTLTAYSRIIDDYPYNKIKPTLKQNWLYTDQKKFINVLFGLFRKHNVEFDADYDFAYASIQNFLKTFPPINNYYNNLNSEFWLSWCYALLMNSKEHNVNKDLQYTNISEVVDFILPFYDYCLNKTKQYIIPETFENNKKTRY